MKKRFLHASIMLLAVYQATEHAGAVVRLTPDRFSHVLTQYNTTN